MSATDFGIAPAGLKINGTIPSGLQGRSYNIYISDSGNISSPWSSNNDYVARSSSSSTVSISSSPVTVPLYAYGNSSSLWDGEGSYYVYLVSSSSPYSIVAKSNSAISFSNGSYTISNAASALVPWGLTINGFSPGTSGNYKVYVCASSTTTPWSSSYDASGDLSTTGTVSLYSYGSTTTPWTGSSGYYVYLVSGSSSSDYRVVGKTASSSSLVTFQYGSATIDTSVLVPTGLSISNFSSLGLSTGTIYQVYIRENSTPPTSWSSSSYVASGSISSSNSTTPVALITSGSSATSNPLRWTGDNSYYVYLVSGTSTSSLTVARSAQITFAYGSATTSLSRLGLTINNISSTVLSGTYKVYITSNNTSTPWSNYLAASPSDLAIDNNSTSPVVPLSPYDSSSNSLWSSTGSSCYVYLVRTVSSTNQIVVARGDTSFTNGSGTTELSLPKLTIINISTDSLSGTYKVYITSNSVNNSSWSTTTYLASSSDVTINSTPTPLVVPLSLSGSSGNSYLWSSTEGSPCYVYLVRAGSSNNQIVASDWTSFTNGSATIDASSSLTISGLQISSISSLNLSNGTYTVYVSTANSWSSSSNNTASGTLTISGSTATAPVLLFPSNSTTSQWTGSSGSTSYYVYLVNAPSTVVAKSNSTVSFSFGRATTSLTPVP
jgi:hypothetical protein